MRASMQMNGQWYTELESYGNPMCFTVELLRCLQLPRGHCAPS